VNPSGFAHLDSMAWKSPTRRHAANAVTAVRVLLLPVMLGSIATHQRILAVLVFLVVAASDYFDGRIARHYGAESRAGRVFDHVADIAFILATLGLYVMLGVVPWWVPVSIGLSFAVYVSDSVLRSRGRGGAQLVGSRVGHLGGVLNYTLIGILVFDQTAGLQWIPPALMAVFFFLVPIYSGAAILTRFLPASPDP
jgi:phosphatidylglycerophosphate synthase